MKKQIEIPIGIYGMGARIVRDYYKLVSDYMEGNKERFRGKFRDIRIEGYDVTEGSDGQISLAINFSNIHTPSSVGFKHHHIDLHVSKDITRTILVKSDQTQQIFVLPVWEQDQDIKRFLVKEIEENLLKGFNNEARYALVLEMFCKNYPQFRWEKSTPEVDQEEGIDYHLRNGVDRIEYDIDVKSSLNGARIARVKYEQENEARKKRGERLERRLFIFFNSRQSIHEGYGQLEHIIKPTKKG